jgi:heme-degrading monooxygenase HmoA
MAVLMVLEGPGMTTEQYDRTNEIAHVERDVPQGLVSHVCAVDEQGLVVVDVWESEEAFGRFFESRLAAALEQVQVPELSEPRFFPVHNMIPKGSSDDARVLLIVEPERFTPAEYDQLITTMDAHIGSGERHPGVSHVVGRKDDGNLIVVDLWQSQEAFDEFARDQLAPVADRIGPMDTRFAKVHNRIRPAVPAVA